MSVLVVLGDLGVLEVKLRTAIYMQETQRNKNFAASNRKATIYFKEMVKSKIQNKKDHFTDHTTIEERFIWIKIKKVPTTFDN